MAKEGLFPLRHEHSCGVQQAWRAEVELMGSLAPQETQAGRQRRKTVPSPAEEEKSTAPPRKLSPKSFMA